ncbi:facilitated trehalose transporter Tret1-like [Cimex lectularius]|uniref:Major facilitator superfamily (MFS) profile domain-containing protein n=1 Tax=Cimex lectularius TaxID=79782 RepID=A0A8I6S7H8_CIMLE|nr:facilitated trehalose transporter Tret1-like [Cimex lectularius]
MQLPSASILRQYLAAFISSLTLFCAGNCYTWITPLLYRLKEPDSEIPLTADQGSWVVALIEVGNLITPIPAGFLVDLWGRKIMLWLTGPIYIFTWILALSTRSVITLYFMRTVQGMAMSVQFTVLPMYLGEISGPKLRGALSSFFQGMWYLGVLYEYSVGAFFDYEGLTWFSIAPPVIFVVLFLWCPESPYYLVMKGRQEEAAKALSWLRATTPDSPELLQELQQMQTSIQEEKEQKGNWRDILGTREGRKALFLVQTVAVTEIMSGLTTIIVYVSETFARTSGDPHMADVFTIVLGGLLFLVTLVTAVLVDKVGRRPLILISSFGGSACLFLAALYYILDELPSVDTSTIQWLPYIAIIGFMCLISLGVGALLPALQSEFFPNSTRGIASGITILNITLMSFMCLKLYQVIEDSVGLYLNYCLFFISSLIGSVLIFFFLPETKGKTFAEIQKMM